ncbi:hypothetical protein AXL3_53 [Stenotrophomonas phage vB_SmaS-AXL_3]|uniref:Uncharacterized protein n=1 Tax=Stenotrophomonas phage vB_SmaS-AXL_3 TaxID=2740427 RepID=A0A7D4XK01_9CAUD|nr:hypothetical protein PQE62_gp53 [Stenotrophomonas phage vB_SmaS-AXL_3]QKW95591.1 hypothetical protein AXL3_53 [Stenotrophomonas phage vB_SmaS-AXL_3]
MIPTLDDIIRGLLNGTMTPEQAMFYLEQHEKLQAEVDGLGDVPYARGAVTIDVLKKCAQQDRRWGLREYPSFNVGMTSNADIGPNQLAGFHEVVAPVRARLLTQTQDDQGELSWMTILVEEVAKLVDFYEKPEELRAQLIDVAGVATQWAAQLTPEPEFEQVEADHEGPNLR